jgi:hypothetical protein
VAIVTAGVILRMTSLKNEEMGHDTANHAR